MSLDFRNALKELKDPSKQESQMQASLTELQAEQVETLTKLADLQVELEGKEVAMAELNSLLAAEKEAVVTMSEELTALRAAQEEALVQAEAQRMEARKASLSAVISEEQLEVTFESVKGLEDAQFNTILSALSANYKQEQESVLFTEVGVETQGNDVTDEESALSKKLKAKYTK